MTATTIRPARESKLETLRAIEMDCQAVAKVADAFGKGFAGHRDLH